MMENDGNLGYPIRQTAVILAVFWLKSKHLSDLVSQEAIGRFSYVLFVCGSTTQQ